MRGSTEDELVTSVQVANFQWGKGSEEITVTHS